MPEQEDAAQHELGDDVGMLLGVGQREGGAPRAPEHHPPLDAEVGAHPLDVVHEVPRGVVLHVGVRRALAAAALVEQHDAVGVGVEEAPLPRGGAGTRPAVQHDDRLAGRVARLLSVHRVTVAHVEEERLAGLDLRVELTHGVMPERSGEGLGLQLLELGIVDHAVRLQVGQLLELLGRAALRRRLLRRRT